MQITWQKSEIDLDNLGSCDVCDQPAETLTRDIKVTSLLDGKGWADGPVSYIVRRFCAAHRRDGTVAVVRESQDAYFARLRASEGAKI